MPMLLKIINNKILKKKFLIWGVEERTKRNILVCVYFDV